MEMICKECGMIYIFNNGSMPHIMKCCGKQNFVKRNAVNIQIEENLPKKEEIEQTQKNSQEL